MYYYVYYVYVLYYVYVVYYVYYAYYTEYVYSIYLIYTGLGLGCPIYSVCSIPQIEIDRGLDG